MLWVAHRLIPQTTYETSSYPKCPCERPGYIVLSSQSYPTQAVLQRMNQNILPPTENHQPSKKDSHHLWHHLNATTQHVHHTNSCNTQTSNTSTTKVTREVDQSRAIPSRSATDPWIQASPWQHYITGSPSHGASTALHWITPRNRASNPVDTSLLWKAKNICILDFNMQKELKPIKPTLCNGQKTFQITTEKPSTYNPKSKNQLYPSSSPSAI